MRNRDFLYLTLHIKFTPFDAWLLTAMSLIISLVFIDDNRAGKFGAVSKISAFRPQGPQFGPGSAEI